MHIETRTNQQKDHFNYLATFPAGCFDIIYKDIKKYSLKNLEVVNHDNSALIMSSNLAISKLINIRYFTNIYLIIEDDTEIKTFLQGHYYKLVYLNNAQPDSLSHQLQIDFTSKIAKQYNLTANSHLSKNNFYYIARKNTKTLLTLKLHKPIYKSKKLTAGQLRPELANIICLLANLKPKQIVVDLFSGSGQLSNEAVQGFNCQFVIAIDITKDKFNSRYSAIKFHQFDINKLDFILDNSVDRVIADPPWGQYKNIEDLAGLYNNFLSETYRILRPNAYAIILSGYSKAEDSILKNKFIIDKRFNILVNGAKANLYKINKR